MTPDFDRLVTAAENGYQEASLPNEELSQRTAQAIVIATLKELRNLLKLSDDVLDDIDEAAVAGATQSVNSRLLRMAKAGRKGPVGLAPAEWLAPVLEALIDGVLGTKARRAEALDELARLDGDLL